ncbi:hypothetical protein L0N08_14940, partial [Enterocloster aldenensis]|nr:hypothetical protein [Enterocloster aldenensis]
FAGLFVYIIHDLKGISYKEIRDLTAHKNLLWGLLSLIFQSLFLSFWLPTPSPAPPDNGQIP